MTLRKKVVEVWRKRVTEEDRDTKAPHRRPEVSQRLCNALPCPQTRSSQRQRTFVFAPVGPIQFNSIRMILEIGDSMTFYTFRDNDDICPLCCWQLILISNLLVADFLSQFLLKIFTHVVTNTHFTYSNITFTMPCYTIWHFFQNIPSNFFPHLAHFNRALHIFTVWISHPREMILVSAKYFCRALSQFCQIILPDAPLTTTRRLDYQLFSLSLYVISDRLLLVWRLQKMQLTKTTQSLRKRAHLRPMTRPSPDRGRLSDCHRERVEATWSNNSCSGFLSGIGIVCSARPTSLPAEKLCHISRRWNAGHLWKQEELAETYFQSQQSGAKKDVTYFTKKFLSVGQALFWRFSDGRCFITMHSWSLSLYPSARQASFLLENSKALNGKITVQWNDHHFTKLTSAPFGWWVAKLWSEFGL